MESLERLRGRRLRLIQNRRHARLTRLQSGIGGAGRRESFKPGGRHGDLGICRPLRGCHAPPLWLGRPRPQARRRWGQSGSSSPPLTNPRQNHLFRLDGHEIPAVRRRVIPEGHPTWKGVMMLTRCWLTERGPDETRNAGAAPQALVERLILTPSHLPGRRLPPSRRSPVGAGSR